MFFYFIELNQKTDSTVECGFNTTLTLEEQHIYTPNYPDNYPDNAECKWYIVVPEDGYMRFVLNGRVGYRNFEVIFSIKLLICI